MNRRERYKPEQPAAIEALPIFSVIYGYDGYFYKNPTSIRLWVPVITWSDRAPKGLKIGTYRGVYFFSTKPRALSAARRLLRMGPLMKRNLIRLERWEPTK